MSRVHMLMAGALTAFAMAAPLAASAQGLPQSLDMSCADAQALVARRGAVVLATGPNVYNRYVRDMRSCDWGQVTKPVWIRTRDTQQCPVGFICWDPSNDGGAR